MRIGDRDYRCAAGVRWTVEAGRLRLLRIPGGLIREVHYPEAAAWDFFVRGLDAERAATMLRHIGGFESLDAAKTRLRDYLRGWQREALVVEDA